MKMKGNEDRPTVLDYDASSGAFTPIGGKPLPALRPIYDLYYRSYPIIKHVGRAMFEQAVWRVLQIITLGLVAGSVFIVVKLVFWLIGELSRL